MLPQNQNKLPLLPIGLPLENWLQQNGEKSFRAKQVCEWIYVRRAEQFSEMTNLPVKLRDQLAGEFAIFTTEIARHLQSADGTEKLLVSLADFEREANSIADRGSGVELDQVSAEAAKLSQVECVLLRDGIRRTICVSSQVGCAMGCVFCASGLDGVKRGLTAGEILEQMLRLQRLLPGDERLSHIVMMGMGEPLANLPNVLAALDVATSPQGLGISPRRVTISTVGLPAGIDRLARHNKPYNLAVSLHAPNDALRDELVPVNSRTGIESILEAADRYFEVSGRRLTFEYVLLGGVNDAEEQARELVRVIGNRCAMMNLIPYNRVEGLPWKTPEPAVVRRFVEILESGGLNVQRRERKGDEISAACGQLRRVAQTQ